MCVCVYVWFVSEQWTDSCISEFFIFLFYFLRFISYYILFYFILFCWAVWHSCRMGYRNQRHICGRVGKLQPLSLMYSTRPCCLVQAITRHTCPDPDLDSWICFLIRHTLHLVGQWAVQTSRGRVSARSRPFPALYPHYNHWPCVSSCLVGGTSSYFIDSLYPFVSIYLSIYLSILPSGVVVIVIGNGHGDTSSNPGRDWLHFTIALIPLGKVWIQLFSLQLWVNSRTD